jgi:hypothetical protein
MAERKPWSLFLIAWCVCLGVALLGVGFARMTLNADHPRPGLLATLAWPIGGSLLMALAVSAGHRAKRRR